jgi:hypothetical protein
MRREREVEVVIIVSCGGNQQGTGKGGRWVYFLWQPHTASFDYMISSPFHQSECNMEAAARRTERGRRKEKVNISIVLHVDRSI